MSIPTQTRESDRLLEEQKRYYRARAQEYDDSWEHRGRHDRGEAGNRSWWTEVAELRRFFEAAPIAGEILEPAGGTGIWTKFLARRADHVTVLDASPEALAINGDRLESAGLGGRVAYEQVDLFEWRPSRTYDSVFLGYWLSHVPRARLAPFLDVVAAALRPGGCVAFFDSKPQSIMRGATPFDGDVEMRTLNDGTAFHIVKRYYTPAELAEAFANHGIEIDVRTTATRFVYGAGVKR
jgi:demethylmenaquinone methyltransferase/2-methoxy-6-polyprenyl-1,4-benzoquinol methylase